MYHPEVSLLCSAFGTFPLNSRLSQMFSNVFETVPVVKKFDVPRLTSSVGSLCDGQCRSPSRVSAARHLSDLHRSAHNPVDAVRLLARLRQRKQGQHRLATPA